VPTPDPEMVAAFNEVRRAQGRPPLSPAEEAAFCAPLEERDPQAGYPATEAEAVAMLATMRRQETPGG